INGKIQLDGGTLTNNVALTIDASATLTGFGKVNGLVNGPAIAGGTGTISAAGGTLEVTSSVVRGGAQTLALTVGRAATDKLLLDAPSNVNSLTFSGSTGTLEINTSGSLILVNALSIGANTVKLDGASSQLTDNAGISLSTGTITGLGKVTGAVSASGAASITANGGTVENAYSISNTGTLALTIPGGSDKLRLDAG